jgi:hypothetical protein
MNLSDRRQKLAADLALVEQQQSRLLAAAQDAARQAEQLRGAIALCDELLQADPLPDYAAPTGPPRGDADG